MMESVLTGFAVCIMGIMAISLFIATLQRKKISRESRDILNDIQGRASNARSVEELDLLLVDVEVFIDKAFSLVDKLKAGSLMWFIVGKKEGIITERLNHLNANITKAEEALAKE